MMGKDSKFQIYQQASLSQKVSYDLPDFQELAGSDPETSMAIQNLKTLGKHNLIDLDQPEFKLVMDLLNGKRMALFATSEKTNEITKLGFMLPKGSSVVDFSDDTE